MYIKESQNHVIHHLNGDQCINEPKTHSTTPLYRGFSSDITFNIGDHITLSQIGQHFTTDLNVAYDFAQGSSSFTGQPAWVLALDTPVMGVDIYNTYMTYYSDDEEYQSYRRMVEQEKEFFVTQLITLEIVRITETTQLYPVYMLETKLVKGDVHDGSSLI